MNEWMDNEWMGDSEWMEEGVAGLGEGLTRASAAQTAVFMGLRKIDFTTAFQGHLNCFFFLLPCLISWKPK